MNEEQNPLNPTAVPASPPASGLTAADFIPTTTPAQAAIPTAPNIAAPTTSANLPDQTASINSPPSPSLAPTSAGATVTPATTTKTLDLTSINGGAKRKTWLIIAALVLAFLALGGGLYFFFFPSTQTSSTDCKSGLDCLSESAITSTTNNVSPSANPTNTNAVATIAPTPGQAIPTNLVGLFETFGEECPAGSAQLVTDYLTLDLKADGSYIHTTTTCDNQIQNQGQCQFADMTLTCHHNATAPQANQTYVFSVGESGTTIYDEGRSDIYFKFTLTDD
jgi:hypothetical protein